MSTSLYETDFYQWARTTALLLRERRFQEIDRENTAEEIEALGRNDRHEIMRRSYYLIAHLLTKRTSKSEEKIARHRSSILKILTDSPSLRRMLPDIAEREWEPAVKLAMAATGLQRDAFPAACPFTLEEIYGADILAM